MADLIFAEASSSDGALTEAEVSRWQKEGYALISDLFPAELISELRSAALEAYPAPGSEEAEAISDFGSFGSFNFPSQSKALNEITLYEPLLNAIGQLLNVPDRAVGVGTLVGLYSIPDALNGVDGKGVRQLMLFEEFAAYRRF